MNKFVWLVILILILILIFTNKEIVEGYNDRHTNMTFEQCANLCEGTAGCFGFGYDNSDKNCFLADEALQRNPNNPDTLFLDEYHKSHVVCNKIEPILVASKNIPFTERRKNSVFVCSEAEDIHPQWYFHYKDKFINIGEGKNIDEIFDVDQYEVKAYRWPTNKYSTDQLDLLKSDREKQHYSGSNVTNLNRAT